MCLKSLLWIGSPFQSHKHDSNVVLVWNVPKALVRDGFIPLIQTNIIPRVFLKSLVPEVLVPDGIIPLNYMNSTPRVLLVWHVPEVLAPDGDIPLNDTNLIPSVFLVWDIPKVLARDELSLPIIPILFPGCALKG